MMRILSNLETLLAVGIVYGVVLLAGCGGDVKGTGAKDAGQPASQGGGTTCSQNANVQGDNNTVNFGDQTCEGGRGDQNTGDQSQTSEDMSCSQAELDDCNHDSSGECCQ